MTEAKLPKEEIHPYLPPVVPLLVDGEVFIPPMELPEVP
jgi:hypothetical protein